MNTLNLLRKFANQKPSLDFNNYGNRSAYQKESREITKDLHDFRELVYLASARIEDLNDKLTSYLENTGGRLCLKDGELEYTTGQYFPTEYRPAANNVLRDVIFADYRDEKDSEGNDLYSTGHDIRKAIRRKVSRRVASNYFN